MRPVSRVSSNNKSSQRPVSAQVARRRELRRQRRQTLLLQLWRFVAMLILSGGFSWILLRHGWTLRSREAVILTGGAALETNQVIEAAKLRFPSPLLEVGPRELEQQLVGALPVHSAHVQRRMFPARLVISLKPEIPIARAERRGPAGRERGLLNAAGGWIPLSDAVADPLTDICVSKSQFSIIIFNIFVQMRNGIQNKLMENHHCKNRIRFLVGRHIRTTCTKHF